ncbi:MAG: DNA polymerase ligase N-terminal domain-containing protein [Candidatus Hodarchaeales archaeon]|jgi:DNA ligase D-like protein (predicted 3'-phosphoesterase)
MIFVIHKHQAYGARLHYDLRLEYEGRLLSWVLRKTPPVTVGQKRLAIPVNDHPVEYASFEGTIPRGIYGGGTVSIFDEGHLEWITSRNQRYFQLTGQKLQGIYTLAPFRENFLFYKIISRDLGFFAYREKPTDLYSPLEFIAKYITQVKDEPIPEVLITETSTKRFRNLKL